MPDGTTPTIPPKDAIAFGMKHFRDLMEGQPASRVLLEGLSLDEVSGNWIVTFGFDSERPIPERLSPLLDAVTQVGKALRPRDIELVREFRAVHVSSSDGQFIKMEHA